jgi:hypothetical protein
MHWARPAASLPRRRPDLAAIRRPPLGRGHIMLFLAGAPTHRLTIGGLGRFGL